MRSSQTTTKIGRRRGTRSSSSRKGGMSTRALIVLAALCLSIFAMGLILGARMVLNTAADDVSGTTAEKSAAGGGGSAAAGASPHHARVGVKDAAKEITRLIEDSAMAEAALVKEKVHKLGNRLRGGGQKLAKDDPNYNPHHHIDDDDAGADGGGAGGGGGGAAVAVGTYKAHANVADTDVGKTDPSKKDFPYLGPPIAPDHDFTTFKPPGGKRFEEYKNGGTPYTVTTEIRAQSDEVARTRRAHIKAAMQHAWKGYKEHAFGMDEVHPLSANGHNNWGGMGTTLVDSLDTLWLMGMKDEFWEGRDWVRDHLDHTHVHDVSVFETTIRSLGGLLAAYDWSGDQAFLDKADDLGRRLFAAFNSPSGLPWGQINLGNANNGHNAGWAGGNAILSEVGTLQIEFRYLAKATGKKTYAEKSERVFEIMNQIMPEDGLMPLYVRNSVKTPAFSNNKISLGAMGDSIYEYMLKIWLQGGRKEPLYREMYDKSMQGVHDKLLQKSNPSGLTYFADLNGGRLNHKMDHLVCFMGGLLALGAYTDPQGFDSPRAQRDMKAAKAVTYTCYQMYARMETGISPEYVQFGGDDFSVPSNAPYYILRPETVESFFILHQITGDPVYREWGWEVFQSIERYCKTRIAYGSLHDVRKPNQGPEDRMESFFLAETIKYLYLLQDPDTEVDVLHKHVFNTEAHPMRNFVEFKGKS